MPRTSGQAKFAAKRGVIVTVKQRNDAVLKITDGHIVSNSCRQVQLPHAYMSAHFD
jgi:hypothetical protein